MDGDQVHTNAQNSNVENSLVIKGDCSKEPHSDGSEVSLNENKTDQLSNCEPVESNLSDQKSIHPAENQISKDVRDHIKSNCSEKSIENEGNIDTTTSQIEKKIPENRVVETENCKQIHLDLVNNVNLLGSDDTLVDKLEGKARTTEKWFGEQHTSSLNMDLSSKCIENSETVSQASSQHEDVDGDVISDRPDKANAGLSDISDEDIENYGESNEKHPSNDGSLIPSSEALLADKENLESSSSQPDGNLVDSIDGDSDAISDNAPNIIVESIESSEPSSTESKLSDSKKCSSEPFSIKTNLEGSVEDSSKNIVKPIESLKTSETISTEIKSVDSLEGVSENTSPKTKLAEPLEDVPLNISSETNPVELSESVSDTVSSKTNPESVEGVSGNISSETNLVESSKAVLETISSETNPTESVEGVSNTISSKTNLVESLEGVSKNIPAETNPVESLKAVLESTSSKNNQIESLGGVSSENQLQSLKGFAKTISTETISVKSSETISGTDSTASKILDLVEGYVSETISSETKATESTSKTDITQISSEILITESTETNIDNKVLKENDSVSDRAVDGSSNKDLTSKDRDNALSDTFTDDQKSDTSKSLAEISCSETNQQELDRPSKENNIADVLVQSDEAKQSKEDVEPMDVDNDKTDEPMEVDDFEQKSENQNEFDNTKEDVNKGDVSSECIETHVKTSESDNLVTNEENLRKSGEILQSENKINLEQPSENLKESCVENKDTSNVIADNNEKDESLIEKDNQCSEEKSLECAEENNAKDLEKRENSDLSQKMMNSLEDRKTKENSSNASLSEEKRSKYEKVEDKIESSSQAESSTVTEQKDDDNRDENDYVEVLKSVSEGSVSKESENFEKIEAKRDDKSEENKVSRDKKITSDTRTSENTQIKSSDENEKVTEDIEESNVEDSGSKIQKLDEQVIYEKFDLKPLTIRADINIEELQKLKSAPIELTGDEVPESATKNDENETDNEIENELKKRKTNVKDKEEEIKADEEKEDARKKATKEKEEAQKKVKEKEEAQKKIKEKEDAQRKVKEKEEAQRKIKEKEEAQRKIKEKEEAQRKVKEKEEVQRKAKEKEEAQRKAKEKEEAQRKAKEKEEAQRKAKEKEEAQRKAKEKDTQKKAIKEKEDVSKKNKDKDDAQKKTSKEKDEIVEKTKEKEETQKKLKLREENRRLTRDKSKIHKPIIDKKKDTADAEKSKVVDNIKKDFPVREPSKRLIIKSQSSINDSVPSANVPIVFSSPYQIYEIWKELKRLVRLHKKNLEETKPSSERKMAGLKAHYQIEAIQTETPSFKTCETCRKTKASKFQIPDTNNAHEFCTLNCALKFALRKFDITSEEVRRRHCLTCKRFVFPDDKTVIWRTNFYCDENCLTKSQQSFGEICKHCTTFLNTKCRGKYCLQRGKITSQFCSSLCRNQFKSIQKFCKVCDKASSLNTPLPVDNAFICSQLCLSKLDSYKKPTSNVLCTVCHQYKPVQFTVLDGDMQSFLCGEKCFKAFNFVNKLSVLPCHLCTRHFDAGRQGDSQVCYYEDIPLSFCSTLCYREYVNNARSKKACSWCQDDKGEGGVIRRVVDNEEYYFCTTSCLKNMSPHKLVNVKCKTCEYCHTSATEQYYITAYTAGRPFCSYKCIYRFHNKIPFEEPPAPSAKPKQVEPPALPPPVTITMPPKVPPKPTVAKIMKPKYEVTKILPKIIRQILVKPQDRKELINVATQCKPTTSTKKVSCKTTSTSREVQTGDDLGKPLLIPVPVPLYVPAPAAMYSMPFPVPVPIPIPIPIPIFIPTTRNSIAGIFKEIKRIQEKIPADPFEAELLMMAEMVASDKKDEGTTDEDSNNGDDDFDNEGGMETSNNAFGEDVLQMAIKMACNDLETPSGGLQDVDLDDALQPTTITINSAPRPENNSEDLDSQDAMYRSNRGRKRGSTNKSPLGRVPPVKRERRISDLITKPPQTVPTPQPPVEKADANLRLKFTFGVNAWKNWVIAKNAELEKATNTAGANRKMPLKLFKTDILQLTADELNFSLSLFIKEVRKPNGTQYAPDTIYYLCLGIQQYLFESGRIDNIFTSPYFEKFTETLEELCGDFSSLYSDTQFIVTRVEEEHLWESKQLGAHSPHVLLNTLMFFNTKYFNLMAVEEHMQLSFSHIMKHWKRSPSMAANVATSCTKAPTGSRNVLLRFYPPQSAIDAPGSRKKKVYEQQENEENPLRCPVRLYEFYLSKCPESVKTRNDVFYLLPERSCVPDSPVWYSTSPLDKEALTKMLHRIKMVKEINIAFLTL